MVRTILAVLVGYVVLTIIIMGVEAALGAVSAKYIESTAALNFLLVFSVIAGIIGGFVTALIAKNRKLFHTAYLGLLMILLNIVSAAFGNNAEPAWFRTALVVVALPSALAGGWIHVRGKAKRAKQQEIATKDI